ncbi:MAG: hypothetical protein KatS3mg090_0477 [Patescibacteria group bacterium]|nr:MAG: hypothetical protein KatS3mg090_0477 [Patescibacteria group bacterium]
MNLGPKNPNILGSPDNNERLNKLKLRIQNLINQIFASIEEFENDSKKINYIFILVQQLSNDLSSLSVAIESGIPNLDIYINKVEKVVNLLEKINNNQSPEDEPSEDKEIYRILNLGHQEALKGSEIQYDIESLKKILANIDVYLKNI